jgi:hypothetical protein
MMLVALMVSNFALVFRMQQSVSIVYPTLLASLEVANDARRTSSFSLQEMLVWHSVLPVSHQMENQGDNVFEMEMKVKSYLQ